MKRNLFKIIINIFIVIVFSNIYYFNVYANEDKKFISKISQKQSESIEKLKTDLIMRMFLPYIEKAVENYYGKSRQFDLWDAKIIDIKRLEEGSFNFQVKISVTTFEGAHNPPYGLETVTIKIDDNGTHIVDFQHKDA